MAEDTLKDRVYTRWSKVRTGTGLYANTSPPQESNNNVFSEQYEGAISNDVGAAAGCIGAEKVNRDELLSAEVISKIKSVADELPEAARKQFIRTAEVAAAVASNGASLNVPYIKCIDRFLETHAAYETEPTYGNAKALTSAYTHLRAEQKKLGLPLQPRDTAVSLAQSKTRDSRAEAPPPAPGKSRRGRPSLTAVPR